VIVSDGAGGAIIAWEDYFSGSDDIFAQRINSNGIPQWTLNGISICSANNDQEYIDIISDGAGGAIMAWEDNYGTNVDIYTQRVNASGATQWLFDGTAICTETGDQYTPKLAEDGSGGAIITWEDQRGTDPDIYAQHINWAGVISGPANGMVISNASGWQFSPSVCSDGSGGAIFVWYDKRNGGWDIYAQKVITGGVLQWAANGIAVNTATGDQLYPNLISDQNGGAIITWQSGTSAAGDIYAQRIGSAGNLIWAANGIAICNASDEQASSEIISDNSDGAIITWRDSRNGNADVYAQRVTSDGEFIWNNNGIEISTADNHQENIKLVSDGNDGAIFSWGDLRNADTDIFVQNVCGSGWMGVCSSSVYSTAHNSSVSVISANNKLTLQLENISELLAELRIMDASGRLVFSQNKVNTTNRFEVSTNGFSAGVYFLSLQTGTEVYAAKFFVN